MRKKEGLRLSGTYGVLTWGKAGGYDCFNNFDLR